MEDRKQECALNLQTLFAATCIILGLLALWVIHDSESFVNYSHVFKNKAGIIYISLTE
jgi:hypothetical protein